MGFITLLLFGPVALNGITGCNDPCNPAPYRFSIRQYKTYPRKLTSQYYQTYLTDTLALNDTVNYRQLELILIGQDSGVVANNQFRGGTNLWACSPAYIALDTIQHVTITSNQSYRTGLGAGSNLADIITIGEGAYDQQPLTAFLTTPPVRAQTFYSLRFTQAPSQTGRYQFLLTIDWGHGKTASFLTRPILIKR